jgi:hypothetical protein
MYAVYARPNILESHIWVQLAEIRTSQRVANLCFMIAFVPLLYAA